MYLNLGLSGLYFRQNGLTPPSIKLWSLHQMISLGQRTVLLAAWTEINEHGWASKRSSHKKQWNFNGKSEGKHISTDTVSFVCVPVCVLHSKCTLYSCKIKIKQIKKINFSIICHQHCCIQTVLTRTPYQRLFIPYFIFLGFHRENVVTQFKFKLLFKLLISKVFYALNARMRAPVTQNIKATNKTLYSFYGLNQDYTPDLNLESCSDNHNYLMIFFFFQFCV